MKVLPPLSTALFVGSVVFGLVFVPISYSQVQIDMSAAYNYDAVGTADEVSWSSAANFPGQNRRLSDTIGNHSLSSAGANNTTRSYVNQASAGAGKTGLPDSGALGGYAISQNFQNGNATDGFVPALNAARVTATATSSSLTTQSLTVTLTALQQTNYESFNILFLAGRSGSSGNYQTIITANYADFSSSIVYDSGLFTATAASQPGGSLGNAGVPTLAGGDGGGFATSTDSSGLVTNVLTTTSQIRSAGSAGSNTAYSLIDGNAGSSIWELVSPIALDDSRVLQSLTFSLSASNNGRFNDLTIFGINATAVPEPATTVLIGLGLSVVLFRRRRCQM